MGRRRTWRSSSSKVGMKSSGSFQPAGRHARGGCLRVVGRWAAVAGCSCWGSSAGSGSGNSVFQVLRSVKSMSLPAAARASKTRSSAAARRMPRLRRARMVERLAMPKHAAMALKLGAVADGVDHMATVGEQDADGVEEELNVGGRNGGGEILFRIGRGGDRRCGLGGLH